MRTITITKNVYKYDELNAKAQERVREWYLAHCRTPELFSEMLDEDLEMIFGENDLDVEYSFSYSLGDGLNIYGSISLTQILDAAEQCDWLTYFDAFRSCFTADEKALIKRYAEDYDTVNIPSNAIYLYNYCYADQIDYVYDYMTNVGQCASGGLLNRVNAALISLFSELCASYEEWGYEFFYDVDDDTLSEVCEANGWEFTEDGELCM